MLLKSNLNKANDKLVTKEIELNKLKNVYINDNNDNDQFETQKKLDNL